MINHYVYNNPIKRRYINEGIKLLGIEKIELTDENKLSGKVIAELDLSCSTSFLSLRIESLKDLNFKKTPTFDKLYSKFKVENINDSKREKDIIKSKPDLGFSVNSFESRAIGLWIYDVIFANKYGNCSQAHTALIDGSWLNGKFKNFESNKIAMTILQILGKEGSELRVFERLHKKTLECVSQHEVLNMK